MRLSLCAAAIWTLASAASGDDAPAIPGAAAPVDVAYAAQGWSDADRAVFYATGQGSRLMPYTWFKSLRRLDADAPFGGDQLRRYGYLADNSPDNPSGLPVGFVVDFRSPKREVGMTCAACHTGQIEYRQAGVTHAIRIDGAPAKADFLAFLLDLEAASGATASDPTRFDAFARGVLGADYSTQSAAQLQIDFGAWASRFAGFMDASRPATPWGPGRLDAFGMIFNRVAGLDLGDPDNLIRADAPVKYPFLWNASRQDLTQWIGNVPNGLYIQALARNTGEALGVFGEFGPSVALKGNVIFPKVIDYHGNSLDFAGLQTLEEKVVTLRPPPWPREIFGLDDQLAAAGKPLFDQYCGGCHAERPSARGGGLWQTRITFEGTDPKAAMNALRTSDPWLYTGAPLPPPNILLRFSNPAKTTDILAGSVLGTLLDEAVTLPVNLQGGVWRALRKDAPGLLPHKAPDMVSPAGPGQASDPAGVIATQLGALYKKTSPSSAPAAYEARVLHGVWAAAPYLHNGSVANLWELLTPPGQRRTSFPVGSRLYDPRNVGFATDPSPAGEGQFVADPTNTNGNGNAGHAWGTTLTPAQRWALIEYLKTF
jgi:mono/diheme cytochrome c family protein